MEPYALDANGNGLPDGVDKYPSFLNELFDNKQPIQRLFGVSLIQGSWITLNFVLFDPGATLEFTNQEITLDATLGVPSVTVMQDPTVPEAPSVISDFCAPLLLDRTTVGQTIDNPCTPAIVAGAACPGTASVSENRGYPLFPCETKNKYDEDADGKVNDGCPQVLSVAETGAECDNNISDDLEDSDVNDGCPVFGAQSEGSRIPGPCAGTDEGGCIFRQNPATPGVRTATTLTASQRDADGDGIENELDVCTLIPNPGWNPRAPGNDDLDFDGLPSACDPNPNVPSGVSPQTCAAGNIGPDEDQDCFSNRADNCPLINQLANANAPPSPSNIPNLNDEDGDGLGDACDPNPFFPDSEGVPRIICLKFGLDVGGAQKSVATYDPDQSLNCAAPPDADGDGISDPDDNCPATFNPGQENLVHPGSVPGDACDDPDGDAVFDDVDNCPDTENPGQENNVHPGTAAGDECDDPDSDGIFDSNDNCPDASNALQRNIVHPGTTAGDACEDPEFDGVVDLDDNCPDTFNPAQENLVHPASPLGDHCDDPDNDAVFDINDNCASSPNPGQENTDQIVSPPGDAQGDACDSDDDDDGFFDAVELGSSGSPPGNVIPSDKLDPGSVPEVCDGSDNDLNEGVDEGFENTDGDSLADCVDPDDDNDTVEDEADNCPTVSNLTQADLDEDGVGDSCDPNIDGDGVPNATDPCPLLAEDLDGVDDWDGCPDADNDLDGVCDPWVSPTLPSCTGSDSCPNQAEDIDAFKDTDGCPDADNDDDGFPDTTDQCPGTDFTVGPDGIADSGDEPLNPLPTLTKEDYDGVIDTDGCHDSPGDDFDGDGLTDEDEVFIHLTNPQNLDTDFDVIADGIEVNCGSDPLDDVSSPERVDGPFGEADEDGSDGVDEALPPSAANFDCDGDGYTGAAEDNVFSYASQTDGDQKTCQQYDLTHPNPEANIKPSLRWPSDFNNATSPLNSFNKITVLDLTSFLVPIRYFGTDVGTNPGDVRWDLVPGSGMFSDDINIVDFVAMITGAIGAPPMLGGAKALSGPECPWAP